jgi:hypothetical protein
MKKTRFLATAASAVFAAGLSFSAPAEEPSGYRATMDSLDEGGQFLLYLDADYFAAQLRAKVERVIRGDGNPGTTMAGVAFDAFLEETGIDSVTDIGWSAGPVTGADFRREKVVIRHSSPARGVFKVIGGEPRASAALAYAPADALVFQSLNVNGDEAMKVARGLASRMGGPEAVAEMQSAMLQTRQATGLDVERLLNSLKGEVALIGGASDKQVTLGDWNGPIADIPLPRLAIMAQIDGATLLKSLGRMVPNLMARDAGGGLQLASLENEGEVLGQNYPYRPGIAWDGKFLIASNDREWLDAMLAASKGEGPRLADSDEYKRMTAGLPAEANAWGYVDARAMALAAKFFDDAAEIASLSGSEWHNPASQIRVIKEIMGLNAEPRSSAYARVNKTDGYYLVRHGGVDMDDVINGVTGGFFATLVAFGVPEMIVSQDEVATTAIQRDLQRIDDAYQEYYIEHNIEESGEIPSIEKLVEMGYLRSMPQPPVSGTRYLPPQKVLNFEDMANPDAYSSFEGPDPNNDRRHPTLIEREAWGGMEAVEPLEDTFMMEEEPSMEEGFIMEEESIEEENWDGVEVDEPDSMGTAELPEDSEE